AHRLGRRGRRVLVLEAGVDAADPGRGEPDPFTAYLTAPVKGPDAPYRPHPAASWPAMTDLTGTAGPPGFRMTGHLLQNGPLPYGSGYLRVNGGTGNVWTGLAPRMLPEDFDTEPFGYGRRWPIGYDDLEPHYRAAEAELGVAADADEQREHTGLPLPGAPVGRPPGPRNRVFRRSIPRECRIPFPMSTPHPAWRFRPIAERCGPQGSPSFVQEERCMIEPDSAGCRCAGGEIGQTGSAPGRRSR
ncbi:GMC family oxidoreductase, partial [Streptomyces clavuligerus]